MAHQHYRTKAVFLQQINRGESDKVFTLFTQEFGKIDVLAKAIRKITAKLNATSGIFNLAEIDFIQGKKQKTLTDVVLHNNFKALKQNSEALSALAEISQKTVDFTAKEQSDTNVWQLLNENLNALNKPKAKCFLIEQYFLWNLLKLSGLLPQVHLCCVCSKKLLPEVLFFSSNEGGCVCWQCKSKANNLLAKEVSVNAIKAIRFFTTNNLETSLNLKLGKKDMAILQETAKLIAKPS